jgi:hypothetical protein
MQALTATPCKAPPATCSFTANRLDAPQSRGTHAHAPQRTGWAAPKRAYIQRMPSAELSAEELQMAAMGYRIGAVQAEAENDAECQENPRLKASFVESVQRNLMLAGKFESARKSTKANHAPPSRRGHLA